MVKQYAIIDRNGNVKGTILLDLETSKWRCDPTQYALLEFETNLGVGKNIFDELSE